MSDWNPDHLAVANLFAWDAAEPHRAAAAERRDATELDRRAAAIRARDERIRILETALRAFPQLSDEADITPEKVCAVAREHIDMLMTWEPAATEITVLNDDGGPVKVFYEEGDPTVGICGGWVVDDDYALIHRAALAGKEEQK